MLAKFIPNLSQIATPLRLYWKRTSSGTGRMNKKSFKSLKQLVTEIPVLKYFDLSEQLQHHGCLQTFFRLFFEKYPVITIAQRISA